MIDLTCISITGILCCAIQNDMLLVTENQLKTYIDSSVDGDMLYKEW
jgi:hypothetical protein